MLLEFVAKVATGNARQPQLEDYCGRRSRAEILQRRSPVGGYLDCVAFGFEQPLQGFLHAAIVFHHQDPLGGGRSPLRKSLRTRHRWGGLIGIFCHAKHVSSYSKTTTASAAPVGLMCLGDNFFTTGGRLGS